MDPQTLSPASRQVEALLDGRADNSLQTYLRQEGARLLEARGDSPSRYELFAVRRNSGVGDDAFRVKPLPLGSYSETELYGAAGSALARFRTAVRTLADRAEAAAALPPEEIEYAHQTTLLWAEVGKLKEFLGVSAAITGVVAELRTARFQFLGKDTPPACVQALARALRQVAEARRLDVALVDEVVETLGRGGVDSLAPEALRAPHG